MIRVHAPWLADSRRTWFCRRCWFWNAVSWRRCNCPRPLECWCCGTPHETRGTDDPWEGRLDGYCRDCALARCDAYPGECPVKVLLRAANSHERTEA